MTFLACAGRRLLRTGLLATTLALAACGGGGGGDSNPAVTPTPTVNANDPNEFLIYPNPIVRADGTVETLSLEWAQAYYRTIDPLDERGTLTKWMAKNGFGTGTGEEISVIFGDQRDLGYGRRMTARRNPNGSLAFMVQNYSVNFSAEYAYSPLSLEAAILGDNRWHIGTNAIEFVSPTGRACDARLDANNDCYPRWYTFNPVTGVREDTVNIDGRGRKAMPGPCISCHGGRGDPLTPPGAGGQRLFNLVQNVATGNRGDVNGRMHSFDVDTFGFSTTPGFTRADQEAKLKRLNQWILCSYPIPAASAFPEDQCRRVAQNTEWQGTAAEMVKAFYGGDGMPNATFADNYVPTGWSTVGQTSLYRGVIGPYCRTCHLLRGTGNASLPDFQSYDKFVKLADRVKYHVQDRGNMPLAFLVYDNFRDSTAPDLIATFLQGQGITSRNGAGTALTPGRPIADPGPERVVRQGASTLSASNSPFSTGYTWSIVSGPAGGATITNPTSVNATFNATQNGTFVVRLVTTGVGGTSDPKDIRIVVNNALNPAPATVSFATHIKPILQNTINDNVNPGCSNGSCHAVGGRAPVIWADYDRAGSGNANDATNLLWLYTEARARINYLDIVGSPLLRKPANSGQADSTLNYHNGSRRPGFDTSVPPGDPARATYDLFVNWILNGGPQ
jgi:hypothetical protein